VTRPPTTTRRGSRYEPRESKSDTPSYSLDAAVDEAMERFVRVLVRRGVSQRTVQRAFRRAWLRVPKKMAEQDRRASRELIDVGHVLTLWFGDPFYVDARGDPLPLPLRGSAPSLASIVQHVDPTLNVTQVLKCLIRADAVRRMGNRYSPRSRAVAFRGTGAPLHARNLRALLGMLRTLEHNIEPKDKVPPWFEYVAENPRFPVSAREPFDVSLRQDAMTFLRNQDSRMLSHQRKAKPGEAAVRMGVGVYRFEEEVSPQSAATGRKKRPGLGSHRTKSRRRRR
jgi:Family of unknown function (DUF6502)